MAWYPPEFVERLRLIKRLQEERYMPLKVIREVLEGEDPSGCALVEVEDRILERAGDGETARLARGGAAALRVPDDVLDRLAEIGVLTPTARGYDAEDVRIIDAIARFRAGGYDERLGFTVYDTLRYREALEPLVEEEVRDAARAPAPAREATGGGHRRRGRRAAARAHRRDALQAAARRARASAARLSDRRGRARRRRRGALPSACMPSRVGHAA